MLKILKQISLEWKQLNYEIIFISIIIILAGFASCYEKRVTIYIFTTIVIVTTLQVLVEGFMKQQPMIYSVNLLIFLLAISITTWQSLAIKLPDINSEIPIKLICSKIVEGPAKNNLINHGIGKQIYPIITDDVASAYTRLEITEENSKRYDSDLYYFLFIKWLNSIYSQGWYLKFKEPLIELSIGHGPIIENNESCTVINFDSLPSEIREKNIFFNNDKLFKSGKFVFGAHSLFRQTSDELSIKLPPKTSITFYIQDQQKGNTIVLENPYCRVEYKMYSFGAGPGLPLDLYSLEQPFNENSFNKTRTIQLQVGYSVKFKSNINESKIMKYQHWAESMLNYHKAFFDWRNREI